MNKQSGLAMILALIFLQIIAILGIYAVQSVIQAEKMSHLDRKRKELLWIAEQVLSDAEKKVMAVQASDCIVPLLDQSELINAPLSWWQSSGACIGNEQSYPFYYLVEKLMTDPCVDLPQFNPSPDKKLAANYFRITVLLLDFKSEARELLQSTVLTLDNAVAVCDQIPHRVVLGRQMWREIR